MGERRNKLVAIRGRFWYYLRIGRLGCILTSREVFTQVKNTHEQLQKKIRKDIRE